MRIFRWLAATAVALGAAASAQTNPQSPPPPAQAQARAAPAPTPTPLSAFQNAPLTPMALRAHVEVLASDEFEGRFPGTRGERLTLDYLRRAFREIGLEPAARDARGRPTFLQEVPLASSRVVGLPQLTITGSGGAQTFAFGPQYVAWTKRLQPRVTVRDAPLVFVGYGIVDRVLGWNDYAGLDMHGKIAVILINDPDFETGDDRGFGGRAMSYYGRWTYKFEEAARQGAAGALIIHETAGAAYPWAVVQSSRRGASLDMIPEDRGASRAGFEGWVTEEVGRGLLERAGLNFAEQKARAQRPDFTPVMMNLRGSLTLDSEINERRSFNVAGVIRGAERPNEVIVYSAHWDHLGRCAPLNGDNICNGALDNASGVAGLIELARRFHNDGRSARSIAFVSFTAEEQGLVGSAYYAAHPLFPAADTVANINMDGLNIAGPSVDVTLIGFGKSEMDQVLIRAARAMRRGISPEAYAERGSFYRSDHLNFARIGVPVLYIAPGLQLRTGGEARGRAFSETYVAERYHRPNDEISDQWNLVGAMQDLLLLHRVGADLADSDEWPAWYSNAEFYTVRQASRAGR